MFNIHFNASQRKEFSKALFNSGNLVFASFILGQIVSDKFDPFMFLIGVFCVVTFFASAMILLKEERGSL